VSRLTYRADSLLRVLMFYSINTGLFTSITAAACFITVNIRISQLNTYILTGLIHSMRQCQTTSSTFPSSSLCVNERRIPFPDHTTPVNSATVYFNALLSNLNARRSLRDQFSGMRSISFDRTRDASFRKDTTDGATSRTRPDVWLLLISEIIADTPRCRR
jgi:hypothetical protein